MELLTVSLLHHWFSYLVCSGHCSWCCLMFLMEHLGVCWRGRGHWVCWWRTVEEWIMGNLWMNSAKVCVFCCEIKLFMFNSSSRLSVGDICGSCYRNRGRRPAESQPPERILHLLFGNEARLHETVCWLSFIVNLVEMLRPLLRCLMFKSNTIIISKLYVDAIDRADASGWMCCVCVEQDRYTAVSFTFWCFQVLLTVTWFQMKVWP